MITYVLPVSLVPVRVFEIYHKNVFREAEEISSFSTLMSNSSNLSIMFPRININCVVCANPRVWLLLAWIADNLMSRWHINLVNSWLWYSKLPMWSLASHLVLLIKWSPNFLMMLPTEFPIASHCVFISSTKLTECAGYLDFRQLLRERTNIAKSLIRFPITR